MPQYTVAAFNWSANGGYNSQYNSSSTVVIDDDDANLDGAADANETVSIDDGAFTVTSGPPYDIDVSFTDVNGDTHVETFYFFNAGGSWYFIPGPGSEFSERATFGSYQSHTTTPTPYSTITCFVRGALVETDSGLVPVEDLRAGDKILCADGEYKTLRLALSRKISAWETDANPKLQPVCIMAGALGHVMPQRDLLVSRQHRMLVSSAICERMFGLEQVLVSAIKTDVFARNFCRS
ncbi:MAG: Hint domain-containing protein [Paracoccaceae bacterium]|nr:Hint domain-containing protein [Paracoccaceae bacterium]